MATPRRSMRLPTYVLHAVDTEVSRRAAANLPGANRTAVIIDAVMAQLRPRPAPAAGVVRSPAPMPTFDEGIAAWKAKRSRSP